jgi:hypothetical protein
VKIRTGHAGSSCLARFWGAWGGPAKVFEFDQIAEAHRLMDSGAANGKLVVWI